MDEKDGPTDAHAHTLPNRGVRREVREAETRRNQRMRERQRPIIILPRLNHAAYSQIRIYDGSWCFVTEKTLVQRYSVDCLYVDDGRLCFAGDRSFGNVGLLLGTYFRGL